MRHQQWYRRYAEWCGPSLPYIPSWYWCHRRSRNCPSRWWAAVEYRNGEEGRYGAGEHSSPVWWAATTYISFQILFFYYRFFFYLFEIQNLKLSVFETIQNSMAGLRIFDDHSVKGLKIMKYLSQLYFWSI